MLEETVREWTREWLEQGRVQGLEEGRAQGIEQGRVQGLEQGRDEERALLCRQAARKFDRSAAEGLVAALAGVTDAERLGRVGDWIIECATASDLLARVRHDHALGQLQEMQTMVENVREWTREWIERGIEQGLEQGRAQGIEQGRVQGLEQSRDEERALLCRQAARKFDGAAAEGLAAALAGVTDAERLGRVGDWIIECATASDLLARVRRDHGLGG